MVNVQISNSRQSSTVERPETFLCLLEVGDTADTPVALFQSVATVTIIDLDDRNGMRGDAILSM